MLDMETRTLESRLASAGMYVRAHLDERLTLEAIAGVAGFSPFHFHRIFRLAFGENLNAYIVRHRMQRAAHELRNGERSILEIGLRCGYDSPSAFGRAFARAFGMTPSSYRAMAHDLPPYPAGSVTQPSVLPPPRIEEYPERAVVALHHVGPFDALDPVMLALYRIAVRRGFLPHASVLGVSSGSPDLDEHDTLRFAGCLTLDGPGDADGARADGLRDFTVHGGRFAVFRHRGPYQRITHAYDVLFSAWVLTGIVELRDAQFVNTYLSDPAATPPALLECDLAIPIH